MAFGKTNSTITKLYQTSTQTKDIYASVTLDNPADTTHRVWVEKHKSESREVGGDNFKSTNKVIGPQLDGLNEGDIIEITPDQIGNEPSPLVKNWRVVEASFYSGFAARNSRIRRMELVIIEEAS